MLRKKDLELTVTLEYYETVLIHRSEIYTVVTKWFASIELNLCMRNEKANVLFVAKNARIDARLKNLC